MISVYKNKILRATEHGEICSVELRGLSTDTKPTEVNGKKIENGSLFIEIDTGNEYMYDLENNRWRAVKKKKISENYAPRYIGFNNYDGTDLDYETRNLDISNLEIMDYMFTSCINLLSLDLSMWNTAHITSFSNIFSNCRNLVTLDLSTFTLDSVANVYGLSGMFNNCDELEKLDIRKFVLSRFTNTINAFVNNLPTTCEIIVKDNTEKQWWNTKYPEYTNVKTVEEYEE